CLNARDAVEEGERAGRRIAVELDAITTANAGGVSTPALRVRISDNGVGMTAGVRARIFEPFFTTKEVGRGSGLGLATAYAIVSEHGGTLTCESVPGEGTTFTLVLPALADAVYESVSPPPSVRGGTETILVVDDERMVRKVVRSVLEPAGYRVL